LNHILLLIPKLLLVLKASFRHSVAAVLLNVHSS
jgi:hypothetical protein